jgi:hypothetical protein
LKSFWVELTLVIKKAAYFLQQAAFLLVYNSYLLIPEEAKLYLLSPSCRIAFER